VVLLLVLTRVDASQIVAFSSSDSTTPLRFSNLLARLIDQVMPAVSFLRCSRYYLFNMNHDIQPVLSRKHAVLLFLHSLASSPPNQASASSGLIASLAPPPPVRTPTPNRAAPPSEPSQPTAKAKTKVELLREYRARIGEEIEIYKLQLVDSLNPQGNPTSLSRSYYEMHCIFSRVSQASTSGLPRKGEATNKRTGSSSSMTR
jgi:hypothetical protein